MNRPILSATALIPALLCGTVMAQPPADTDTDADAPSELDFFSELPVVLHATRLDQPAQKAPVAVTVIDRASIEASGAQDIPTVLRLVPGFQLGRITGARSTVALHGFSDRFQRNMQVLVDGRSVYDPGYGGVFWADLPVTLEDIERIEVIRGPASSLYGANAFSATVNIITIHPGEQRGMTAKVAGGSRRYRKGFVRYAGGNEKLDYRVSLSGDENTGLETRHDYNRTNRLNLRADYQLDANDLLMFSAGLGDGPRDDGFEGDPTQPPRTYENKNRYAQLKWTRVTEPGEEVSLQLYYNYLDVDDEFQTPPLSELFGAPPEFVPLLLNRPDQPLDMGFALKTRRYDLEFQHITHPLPDLRLVWGAGARHDEAYSHSLLLPESADRSSARGFFNTEWQAQPWLTVNAGAMLEKYQGFSAELSPRVSASFHISPRQTLRLSAGRGVRMPTLFEARGYASLRFQDGSLADVFYATEADIHPEIMDSIELGYVGQFPEHGVNLDFRLFRNEVSGWMQQAYDPTYPEPLAEHPVAEVRDTIEGVYVNGNRGRYQVHGLEFAADLKPFKRLRLRLALSATDSEASHIAKVNPIDIRHRNNYAPSTTLSLLGILRLPQQVQLSVGYYHVDPMDWLGEGDLTPGFHEWDARIAKRFRFADADLNLAAVVQNIGGVHKDFQKENLYGSRALLEASVDFR